LTIESAWQQFIAQLKTEDQNLKKHPIK